jgi:class 3 adenylate cyclase/tetratricopeptide (TPR) repeat protein
VTEPAFAARGALMPDHLANKLRAGSAAIEGERRQISVLFADVAGYTALSERTDPEELRAMMRRAFDVMLEAVHRFEGTVAQLLGDGLLALFGAPIAHEDHANRALLAGLALQNGLGPLQRELDERGIDFRVRVGVHSGLVVFGQIGTDLEFTFQAVGDTVNTASRVQGLAEPGTVVASDATHRLAAGHFVFEDLGAHPVKNKAEPVHVFRVVRPTGPRSRVDISAERGLGPFVGREAELAVLQDRWAQALEGHGQVVFVAGEAGLGKSRLVHELRARTANEDHLWLLGRCISYGADIPYVPIVDLVRSACGIEEADAERVMDAKLTRRVEDVGGDPSHLPYLRFLLSLDPGAPGVLDEDPMLRKPRVFEAFRDVLLAAVQRQPTLLVIEDLHWIDPPSIELLSFVAEAVPAHRILMVLTHRPDWDPPLGERPYYTRLALQPLTEPETELVVRGVSGERLLPSGLGEQIYRKAEGNPFYIEEVTKSLLEAGDLVIDGDGYALAKPIDEIRVPDTVQDVIMARLDRLDDEPRLALQTASVIGREFTSRLLERTIGATTSDAAVQQLKAVQLIFERSLYPELVFMFKHALTHEVAYQSLLLEHRRLLHGSVADAIRELYADRPAEVVEMLAHHYERAERWPDAVQYLVASAEKAMSGFALGQALGYADRALAAIERAEGPSDPSIRARMHQLAGQCYELRNEWGAAYERYRKMVDAAADGNDEVTRGFGLALASLAQLYAHDYEEAMTTAREAEAIGEAMADADLTALSRMSVLANQAIAGDLEAAYRNVGELVAAGRAATDVFTKILAIDFAGEMLHFEAREAEAVELIEAASSLAEEARLGQPLQYVYFDLSLTTLALGRYDDAFEAARKNVALCERVGDRGFWWCRAKNTLGRIYMELGDLERGRLHNEEAVERAVSFGDRETLRNAQLNIADCVLGGGDAPGARELLADVEASCAADADPGEWMKWRYSQHLWMSSAMTFLALGDPERALVYADRCVDLARQTRAKRYTSKGHRARGLALSALGRDEDALREAEVALRVADEIGGPEPVWQGLAAQASILAAAGRHDDARDAARGALQVVDGIAERLLEPGTADTLLACADVAALRALAAP